MEIALCETPVEKEAAQVDLVPCTIEYTGPCNTSTYFLRRPNNEDEKEWTASFRGRCLKGERVALPPTYRGTTSTPVILGLIWNDRLYCAGNQTRQVHATCQ